MNSNNLSKDKDSLVEENQKSSAVNEELGETEMQAYEDLNKDKSTQEDFSEGLSSDGE